MLLLRVCSGVSGTIWGAAGNGGGIDELILLLMLRAGELEELRFLGFGDSCGRLRFVVVLIVVIALFAVDWLLLLLLLLATTVALIMVGSGARGR